MSNINYTYLIVAKDDAVGTMEVRYESPGRDPHNISVYQPMAGEALHGVIMREAPIALWLAQETPRMSVEVGVSGSVSGDAPVDPRTPLQIAKDGKLAEIADWRYRLETRGVLIGGARIKTDRESQATMTGAYISLSQGLVTSVDWKAENGQWVTLGLPQVTAIATAVSQHVQSSFSTERELTELVAAANTVLAVESIELPVEAL